MRKKLLALLLSVATLVTLTGCGAKDEIGSADKGKILKVSDSFSISTLNPHLDYQGWYISKYGITETLFKMNDDSSVGPMLAESSNINDKTWTIKLKDSISFSNGNKVTSEMVIRNLKEAGKTNARFAYLNDYSYNAIDDKTFTITTTDVYPTLLNDLASPELSIVDLDNSGDMSKSVIGTGPFVISEFQPSGTIKVSKNGNYWDGNVALDGAEFHYMPDPDTSLLAMQNGEIDAYTNVAASSVEIYEQTPDKYDIEKTSATRLQFYILNQNRLSDSIRKAINLSIDSKSIESYLNGLITSTVGPFTSSAEYGKVTKPAIDINAAKLEIEKDGYKLNSQGYYEKDGKVLTLNIAYYKARSLDVVATVMQEQLKNIGIKATLTCEEDPEGTYIKIGDFDIALYSMIADKAGDPYYFINSTLSKGATLNCGGFDNADVESKINKLKVETDVKKRDELANSIIQTAIDENAFGYIALFNKTTVMRKGVSGVNEKCPFDFYFLNAKTDIR